MRSENLFTYIWLRSSVLPISGVRNYLAIHTFWQLQSLHGEKNLINPLLGIKLEVQLWAAATTKLQGRLQQQDG